MGIRRRIRLQLQQVPSIVRNAVGSNSRLLINALLGFALFGMCPPLFATWTVPSTHSWGGSGTDYSTSVAIDSSGNTYVAGATNSSFGSNDALVLKYDSTGAFAWARTWGGFSDDYATAVGVGPDGYVYVTGGTASYGAGWYDCFLLKLDTSGNLIWNRTWGGPSYDVGHDLAFDSQGNIYVAAETYSASTAAVLLKFDPSGNLLFTRTWKGPATYDSAYSIDLDPNGNVLLAGISWDYSVSPEHNRILLIKFDPNGNLLWSENWQGPGEDEAWGPRVVRADTSGNVYVLGRTTSFGAGGWDLLLLKLDPSGNLLWSSTWGGPGSEGAAQLSGVGGIGFSATGNVIVTSSSNSFLGGAYGAVLLQYTPTGAIVSSQIFAGTSDVLGQAFVLDPSGNVIVAGEAQNASGTWQRTTGSVNAAAGKLLSPTSTVSFPTESVGNPTITLGAPLGVQDSGAGLGDVFISEISAQAVSLSNLPLEAAALAETLVADPYLEGGKGWDWQAGAFVDAPQIEAGYHYLWPPQSTILEPGLDCSGLVFWAYNKSAAATQYINSANPVMYEGADGQYWFNTVPVRQDELQRGDLLFFDYNQDGRMDHVEMYVGQQPFDVVSASTPELGIQFLRKSDQEASAGFVGFRRLSPPIAPMQVIAHSPVSLAVTDPDGLSIDSQTTLITSEEVLHEVPGSLYYSRWKVDSNGQTSDIVFSPVLKPGVYIIKPIPNASAAMTDTYSLDFLANASRINLAQDAPLNSIPENGFAVFSDGTTASLATVSFGGTVEQPLIRDSTGKYRVVVEITNRSNISIASMQVQTAGTVLSTGTLIAAPPAITSFAPGATQQVTLMFPANSIRSGATTALLKLSGTYTAPALSGNWGLSFRSVSLM